LLLIIIVQTLQYFTSGFCSTTRHVFNAIKSLYRAVFPLLQLKRCRCIAFSSVVVYWRSRENRYCFFLFIAHGRCYLLLLFFFFMVSRHKGSRTGFIYEDSRRAIVFRVQYLWTYKVSVRFYSVSLVCTNHRLVSTVCIYIYIGRRWWTSYSQWWYTANIRICAVCVFVLACSVDADWFYFSSFISIRVTLKSPVTRYRGFIRFH